MFCVCAQNITQRYAIGDDFHWQITTHFGHKTYATWSPYELNICLVNYKSNSHGQRHFITQLENFCIDRAPTHMGLKSNSIVTFSRG